VAIILILLNLLNSYIKGLLSDEFNMAAIGNSLMKTEEPLLSNVVMLTIRQSDSHFTEEFFHLV